MARWDRWLSRLDRGWLVAAGAVLFILFLVVVLPGQAQRAQAYTGGVGSPDTDLLATPAELYRYAEAYGVEGRRQYIRARWTFDVLFPLAYGLFFFSAINFSLRRLWPGRQVIARLALLAPAAVLADLGENTLATALMALYPERSIPLALGLAATSALKWLLVFSSMGLALAGLLALPVTRTVGWLRSR